MPQEQRGLRGVAGGAGLNDRALLHRPLLADPQNAGPATCVKNFCVVITLRSPAMRDGQRERVEAAVHTHQQDACSVSSRPEGALLSKCMPLHREDLTLTFLQITVAR
ncbi:hypothetical protein CHARACLAT_004629 [Characodon lateralis]|uniref:Uncharacterized protein n=1 Tax=Characodon lateralis TaxID=208331 RepID=A0ABU7CNK7_9TELE|nr:hypothetical protein [Characodon lateralis]